MEYALPEPKVVNYLLTNPKNPDFFSPLVTQLKVGRGYAMISWLLQIIFRIILGEIRLTVTNMKSLERFKLPMAE